MLPEDKFYGHEPPFAGVGTRIKDFGFDLIPRFRQTSVTQAASAVAAFVYLMTGHF